MNGLQAKRNDAINYVHLVITSSAEFLCMPLLIVRFSEEHFTVIEPTPRKEPERQSLIVGVCARPYFKTLLPVSYLHSFLLHKKTKSRLSVKSGPHCGACRQG